MNITVIFDGECGMCTRTVRMIKRRDKHGVLTFRPCQSMPPEGWQQVTPADCTRAVWAVASDSTVASGADAATLIIAALVGNWWPYRLGRLPVINHIAQAVYRLVANNRRRFPGETPWCQQHPDVCEPTATSWGLEK